MTLAPKRLLSYGRQSIDDDDIAAVADVLRGDFLTTGPMAGKFEQAFARAVAAPFAVVCSSGTAALHLAALALDIGNGDRRRGAVDDVPGNRQCRSPGGCRGGLRRRRSRDRAADAGDAWRQR